VPRSWLQRNVDAIASVVLTVVLILVLPVDGRSWVARLGLFLGILIVVPTIVCLATLALERAAARREEASRDHERRVRTGPA
jgi:hypothetical protein